jgi:Domain of unknown function (DUF4272)
MPTTEEWAQAFGISVASTPPAIADDTDPCGRSCLEIASRALILQGVSAVACDVEARPVIEWLRKQNLWGQLSPREAAFLQNPFVTYEERVRFRWHQEAEWALLWVIGKVDALGLPTRECDTRRLIDEIIPPLGSDITAFLASAELRPPGILLAEDYRTYDLWCEFAEASRDRKPIPTDLNYWVLYERRYAFDWLDGVEDWDDVTCETS